MTINSLCYYLSTFPLTMSDYSVASPATDVAGIADRETANVTPVRLVRFTPELLNLFVDILDEEEADRVTLKQGIEFLLNEH